jgi:PAS domain-containing protein
LRKPQGLDLFAIYNLKNIIQKEL